MSRRAAIRQDLIAQQEGRCALCGFPFHPAFPHCRSGACLDHVRDGSRRVRAALCRACNSRVGHFEKYGPAPGWDPKETGRIRHYLRDHPPLDGVLYQIEEWYAPGGSVAGLSNPGPPTPPYNLDDDIRRLGGQ